MLAFGCSFFVVTQFHTKTDEEKIDPNTIVLSPGMLSPFSTQEKEYRLSKAISDSNFIVLYGSSELSSKSIYKSFLFIPKHTDKELLALGSGGFQSMNIFLSMKLNEPYLDNSKLVILLSPGWFTGNYADGINADYLLKTNSDFSFNRIYQNFSNDIESSEYISSRIFDVTAGEITSAPMGLKLIMNYKKQSLYDKIKKFPLNSSLLVKQQLNQWYKGNLYNEYWALSNSGYEKALNQIKISPSIKEPKFDKKQAIEKSKSDLDSLCSNNNRGILNDYYSKYVNGKHGEVDVRATSKVTEYQDLKELLAYLNRRKVDAIFVMQPLNPYHYTNLKTLNPLLEEIKNEVEQYNFPYLDMTVIDSNKYELGTLQDIMHLGDLGWIRVNDFIIEHHN